ncbi:rhomboid family intramembrane serine protease [Streptomyces sp. ODS28]|uniref:rhomboid family intramembrane serine protease n=1 Tax=Streptomyces sp. ODS28 TaxID=3136688 RepID=UPI0031EA2DE2
MSFRVPFPPRSGAYGGRPGVTLAVIVVSSVLFLTGPASGFLGVYGTGHALERAQEAYFAEWGVLPRDLWSGAARPLLTPVTALFVHGNWVHLLGNLLFLFVFGGWVEERVGSLRFALFYLVTGSAALVCYAAVHPSSTETVVGSSGGISAVLGAFLFLFPRARVTSLFPFLFFLPLRLPAWLVLPFWLLIQGGGVRGDAAGGPGVAHLAHVFGFAMGFGYAWLLRRGEVRRTEAGEGAGGDGRTGTEVTGADKVGGPAPATKGESAP